MTTDINYSHIFRSTSNGIIVTDPKGDIILINRQAKEILHLLSKKTDGAELQTIAPPLGRVFKKSLKSKLSILGQHVVTDEYSIILNVTPIIENSNYLGAVGNFQEMQLFERSAKQLESYLLFNKQFETIFHSVSDAIWVCDGHGVVIDINKASEKINNIKAKDVIGKKIEDLVQAGMYDQSVTSKVLKTKRQVTILQRIMKSGRDVLAT